MLELDDELEELATELDDELELDSELLELELDELLDELSELEELEELLELDELSELLEELLEDESEELDDELDELATELDDELDELSELEELLEELSELEELLEELLELDELEDTPEELLDELEEDGHKNVPSYCIVQVCGPGIFGTFRVNPFISSNGSPNANNSISNTAFEVEFAAFNHRLTIEFGTIVADTKFPR